jgi:hypothetical protein
MHLLVNLLLCCSGPRDSQQTACSCWWSDLLQLHSSCQRPCLWSTPPGWKPAWQLDALSLLEDTW